MSYVSQKTVINALEFQLGEFIANIHVLNADVKNAAIATVAKFDPYDIKSYKPFVIGGNYLIVIHDYHTPENRDDAPAGRIQFETHADITLVRKILNPFDVTNLETVLTAGSADPLITSIDDVATDLSAYFRRDTTYGGAKLEDSDGNATVIHCNIVSSQPADSIDGKSGGLTYEFKTVSFEALSESNARFYSTTEMAPE